MIEEVKGCIKGGCEQRVGKSEGFCAGCGFHEAEAARRRRLPLRQDENGMLRMDVSEEPAAETWRYEEGKGGEVSEARRAELERQSLEQANALLREQVRISAAIMQAAGMCRFRNRASCRRKRKDQETCEACIAAWIAERAGRSAGHDRV